ncbi:hypothetical protein [Curtobacterium sp. TC1]|nr:hypothetical protein [Curtobacterium sp. TC1]
MSATSARLHLVRSRGRRRVVLLDQRSQRDWKYVLIGMPSEL